MIDARFPRLFGKYTLLRPLARGGMGELYLAAAGDLGGAEKLCVIKKLPEVDAAPMEGPFQGSLGSLESLQPQGGADGGGLGAMGSHRARRLLDEARVMVRLNHVNLVQVFDAGTIDGQLYLAMELVAGRDLRAAWNRCADLQARIPVDMALYIVREVARGLAFAHSYGGLHLVHRDVAPPNILCSWQGEVKVTDFGLAVSRLKREHTGPGIVFGRLGYLSPEQARGEQADRRTDIYALGVIMWELLTGRPMVDPGMDAAQTLRWIRESEPARPGYHARDLPHSIDAVVMRALSKDRQQRYATADEMRQTVNRELLRLSPDVDQSCVVNFLRGLYGEEIEKEQEEQERLLREELPKARAAGAAAAAGGFDSHGNGALTGVRAEIAGRYVAAPTSEARPEPAPEAVPAQETAIDDIIQSPGQAERRLGQLVDGRYRIDRLIGLGGMGAVYEAEHVAIRKKVALKVLHPHFSRQPDLLARFRREAQAASRVGHPNIVDVTDFGSTQDGSAYLVMELLVGTDLAGALEEQGKLGQARALRIVVQLVRALGAAHAAGVIHRDLKPENIFLVDPDGVGSAESSDRADSPLRPRVRDLVKVLDFGIATRVDPSMPIRLTNPGLTVGTPEYMAPEQATGDTVDGRADVYAVGALLYEMVAGRLPFVYGSVIELITHKQRDRPPSPRTFAPELSAPLERIILRCLETRPQDRYAGMDDLLRDLLLAQAEMVAERASQAAAALALAVPAASLPSGRSLSGPGGQVLIGAERTADRVAIDPTVEYKGSGKTTSEAERGQKRAAEPAAPQAGKAGPPAGPTAGRQGEGRPPATPANPVLAAWNEALARGPSSRSGTIRREAAGAAAPSATGVASPSSPRTASPSSARAAPPSSPGTSGPVAIPPGTSGTVAVPPGTSGTVAVPRRSAGATAASSPAVPAAVPKAAGRSGTTAAPASAASAALSGLALPSSLSPPDLRDAALPRSKPAGGRPPPLPASSEDTARPTVARAGIAPPSSPAVPVIASVPASGPAPALPSAADSTLIAPVPPKRSPNGAALGIQLPDAQAPPAKRGGAAPAMAPLPLPPISSAPDAASNSGPDAAGNSTPFAAGNSGPFVVSSAAPYAGGNSGRYAASNSAPIIVSGAAPLAASGPAGSAVPLMHSGAIGVSTPHPLRPARHDLSPTRLARQEVRSTAPSAPRRSVLWRFGVPAVGAWLLIAVGFGAARFFPVASPPSSVRSAQQHNRVLLATARSPAKNLATATTPATPTAPPPVKEDPVRPLLEWARRASDNGRYDAPPGDNLIDLLARVDAVSPNNQDAKALRAEAAAAVVRKGREALDEKDLPAALGYHRVLAVLQPDAPFPRSDLSYLLQLQARANEKKNRKKALDSALAAVEVAPESVPARLILGEVDLLIGKGEQAAAEFHRALELHPYPAEEHFARQGLLKAERPVGRHHHH